MLMKVRVHRLELMLLEVSSLLLLAPEPKVGSVVVTASQRRTSKVLNGLLHWGGRPNYMGRRHFAQMVDKNGRARIQDISKDLNLSENDVLWYFGRNQRFQIFRAKGHESVARHPRGFKGTRIPEFPYDEEPPDAVVPFSAFPAGQQPASPAPPHGMDTKAAEVKEDDKKVATGGGKGVFSVPSDEEDVGDVYALGEELRKAISEAQTPQEVEVIEAKIARQIKKKGQTDMGKPAASSGGGRGARPRSPTGPTRAHRLGDRIREVRASYNMRQRDSNYQPSDLESDVLPLRHTTLEEQGTARPRPYLFPPREA
jgi:hypothetical protein